MAQEVDDHSTEDTDAPAWWISLNVARTRVSLLGFNLTVVAFLFGTMLSIHQEQVFTHHLAVMAALYLSFTLSFLSAMCLLASQEFDREGMSRPWLFAVGDMLMYVALSQSLGAMMRTSLRALDRSTEAVQLQHDLPMIGEVVVITMAVLALLAWSATIYVGPIVSMLRSPVRRGSRWLLATIYVAVVLIVFVVAVDAHLVEDVVLDEPEPLWQIFLWQFVQPLMW